MPMVEPGRAIAAAVAMDCPVPKHSSVGSAELTGHLLVVGVAAEPNDTVRAEPL
jgi:hypothetical protein